MSRFDLDSGSAGRPLSSTLWVWMILLLYPCLASSETRVFRDKWGVPHIYADSEPQLMFGFGYAQAQDRLEDLLKNYLDATGTLAGVFGKDHVESDFQGRLWEHGRWSQAAYETIDSRTRALIEQYLEGIKRFMQDNPDLAPPWAFEPEPYHVVALGRLLSWEPLLRQADAEYRGHRYPSLTGNQWVVGPSRSSEDAVVLCSDPHFVWNRLSWRYEAHLHGGSIDAYGFTVTGLPVLLVGHNSRLGWSAVWGGSDGADVYEIHLESPESNRFRFDQGYREIKTESMRIEVRSADTEELSYQRTHLGPILHRRDNRAFAYRLTLQSEVGQIEQLYRQMTARDLKGFLAALGMAQLGPQRILYGDSDGNIMLIRTGKIPIRSEVYAWHHPVPGNTTASDWLGFHDLGDLIQSRNPAQGWIADCATSPDLAMPYSSLTPDRYPDYIFNEVPGAESPRSSRLRTLLSSLSRITEGEALEVATDLFIADSDRWIRELDVAYEAHGLKLADVQPDLGRAVKILRAWNGRAGRDSKGMTVYERWWKYLRGRGHGIDAAGVRSAGKLSDDSQIALLGALSRAVEDMKTNDGRLKVPWGEVHRIGAANRTIGVSGSHGEGVESLRVVMTEKERFLRRAVGGQTCTTLMVFPAGGAVKSFSMVPFGQSSDDRSPHAFDQTEPLFAVGRMKPTKFRTGPAPEGLQLDRSFKRD